MVHWEIVLLKDVPKLNQPLFIEGLPGIGNVGKITVDYLIEELKAEKLYSFFSYRFPNSIFVNEENLVEMPKLEIYYKKFNGKRRDLLILTGDIQPIDEESCYTFCEEVLKIARQFNCSEIITTGGIGLGNIPEEPRVYCTGNDKKMLQEYLRRSSLLQKKIFGVVGPIIGVSGVMLGLGRKRGVKGIALLAETFGHPMYFGIKGAKEILKVLEEVLHLQLDLKKMSKEIVEVEKELLKKTSEWAAEMAAHSRAGAKAKDQEASYIG